MKKKFQTICFDFYKFLQWVVIAILTGLLAGGVGVAFVKGLSFVTGLRIEHPILILGLPLAGLAIVALYKMCRYENDRGTSGVIAAIHEGTDVPFRMAPLIFISTLLTHMFGGSAGREGAALQLGGSIGNQIGRMLKRDEHDKRTLVICGMSAAFSAIFGTPMAAVIFAMEVNHVGIMQYGALVPCAVASLVASAVGNHFGVFAENFGTVETVSFRLFPVLKIALLGILVALLSIGFCKLLHLSGKYYQKWLKNAYLRIAVAGLLVTGLTILLRTSDYNGAGTNLIEQAIAGETAPYTFALKMIFTALTLGAGFKGGEIVPSFAIGATFGCLFGTLVGLPPSLCAAVAMVSMFCGVTNSPIASMMIGFELFGFGIMKYLLIAVSISYVLSGEHSLYRDQRFTKYSSYHTRKV